MTFKNLPSACNERDGVMSGLVNGVLAGTGAFFEICNRFDLLRRVATEGFFYGASSNETDPTTSWNGFGGVWHSWARIAGRGPCFEKELKVSIRSDVPALNP